MATEPAAEEPTMRTLLVADFAGHAEPKPGAIAVDRQSLEEAMARISPRLSLRVPGLSEDPNGQLDVELRFEAFRDLTPKGIVDQVPALQKLAELRDLAEGHRKGQVDAQALRERAAACLPASAVGLLVSVAEAESATRAATEPVPAKPGASGEGGLESILDLVDAPGASARDTRSAAESLIAAVSDRRSRRKRPLVGVAALVAEIDGLIGAQLESLLGHPELRQLEANWRGLRFLVQSTDFRKPVRLDVVCADIDGAPDAIGRAAADEDYDVVVAGFEVDATPRDHERTRSLAEAGAEAQTPVILGLAPEFFQRESWSELARGQAPYATFEEEAYAAWRGFRGDELSRSLALVANRIAVRAPYGPDGERSRDLPYEEGADGGVLASGVFAVAAVLMRAFGRTGACVQVAGTRHGLVSDLPVIAKEDGAALPVEGAFGNERREDLERIGVCAVQHYQRDVAFVGPLRVFRRPERYPDAEATADAAQQTTLAYQLFATRFVKFLGRTLPELMGSGDGEGVAAALRSAVIAFLSTPAHPLAADHVGIGTEPNERDATLTDVRLRVQPELQIGGRPVNVLLNFSLRL